MKTETEWIIGALKEVKKEEEREKKLVYVERALRYCISITDEDVVEDILNRYGEYAPAQLILYVGKYKEEDPNTLRGLYKAYNYAKQLKEVK